MATAKIVDIPHEVSEKAGRIISNYSVGLAKLTGPESVDTNFCASGTLVTIDDRHAILTASHVVDKLKKAKTFGIILPGFPSGQIHKTTFEMNEVRSLCLSRPTGSIESEVPDIALIILPVARLGDIAARKSFYNISKRQSQLLSHPPEHRAGFWAISGFPQEWISDDLVDGGSKRVVAFNGRFLTGAVTPLQTRAEFDGWEFEVQRDGQYDGPNSFGGYSGGGLWQNLVKEEGGQIRLVESTLLGVAYHQSEFKNDLNLIRCNGRRCIYEFIMRAVRDAP